MPFYRTPTAGHSSHPTRHRSPGYTLIELLVAVAVFGVGIVALMPLVVSTVRANDAASVRTQAVAMAQEKIEELRALPYTDIYSNAGALLLAPGSDTPSPVHARSWQVLAAPALAGDGTDLARIVVTVAWNAPGRGSGSVTLTTSRSRL